MLRPPIQPEKYDLMYVVLKWKDIYIENIRVLSLMVGLKIEGAVKWTGLKSQGPLYHAPMCYCICSNLCQEIIAAPS